MKIILSALKIFKTDLCNKIPYGDSTYLERLSIDLDRYPTVRDTLKGLDNKILIRESHIEKLAVVKSNLEAFLLSLFISIIFYFYSTLLLNAQQIQQIQKNLIKRILLIYIFSYLLPLLLFGIVIREAEMSVKSRFTIKQNNNKNNKKMEKKEKSSKRKKEKTTKKEKKEK